MKWSTPQSPLHTLYERPAIAGAAGRRRRAVGILLILLALRPAGAQPAADDRPAAEWAGRGAFRILAQVGPEKLGGRRADQRPAELPIDFHSELHALGCERTIDLATVQVIQYDLGTGRAQRSTPYAHALGAFDCPFRWYDAVIPYFFPEFADAVSRTDGKIEPEPMARRGYFFNALGDWQRGRLVWMHLQTGDEPSGYAIYFDVLAEGKSPSSLPPAAWVGDGTPRRDLVGVSTMGTDHCRVDLDDWNDDGLVDMVVGEQAGHVFWWPNLGTKEKPEFRYPKFIFADGQPLDAGLAAAPKVVDWDGDGRKDLLVGTHWNRLLFYRNTGTNRDRKLEFRGPVTVEDKLLELPLRPLARGSADVFKRDYYPVVETADWDADGDLDLLAGGYITGLIFFYENQGSAPDGTPRLLARGPLEADGKPLNVRYWCAAPCLADFDADGDLDLVSGNQPVYEHAQKSPEQPEFLCYYENIGSATQARLVERPLLSVGTKLRPRLATPRAADWDGDGDLDLVVSSSMDLYLFENQGTRTHPLFKLHTAGLKTAWGLAAITADQFRDINADGRIDLVRDYTVRLNTGAGNPFGWSAAESVLPEGEHIAHPSGIGDDWFWPYLDDFDRDGKIDVLFGDWGGHVWLHRNLSEPGRPRFDIAGSKFQLAGGAAIKVGPIGKGIAKDFDALQGARTVFAVADFNHDGNHDLVVGDTYGKVRYFRSLGIEPGAQQPNFAEPVEVADLGIRGLVDAADWNGDGWMDVIASAANGRVRVVLNRGAEGPPQFGQGFDPQLPPIPQPRVLVADVNGDGDDDLFLPSTQGACFVERSFLEHGYARAELLAVERKKP